MQLGDAAVHRVTYLMLSLIGKLASRKRIVPIAASTFPVGIGIYDRRRSRLSKDRLRGCGNAESVVLVKAGIQATEVGGDNPDDAVSHIEEEGWTENDGIPDLSVVVIVRRVVALVVEGRAAPPETLDDLTEVDSAASVDGMVVVFEVDAVLRSL